MLLIDKIVYRKMVKKVVSDAINKAGASGLNMPGMNASIPNLRR